MLLGILIGVVIIDIVAAGIDAVHLGILNDLEAGNQAAEEDLLASDDRVFVAALVAAALFLAAIVTFLAWFYRAYANLSRLGAVDPRYKRGWAIGAWFVPILNLFRPKQIANDIWRGSDPSLPPRLAPDWHDGPVPGLIHWWWALWLLTGWLGTRAATTDYAAGTLDEQQSSTTLYIASEVLDAIAAVVLIVVVRRITARQEARRTSLAGGSQA